MDAAMQSSSNGFALLFLTFLVGCSSAGKQPPAPAPPPIVGRGTQAAPKPLAGADVPKAPAQQQDEPDDRLLLIPPPPTIDELKGPTKPAVVAADPDVKLTSTESAVRAASNIEAAILTTRGAPLTRAQDDALVAIKELHQRAVESYAKIDCFDARLIRRESVNGKVNPQETIYFMFRKEPFSVRLKWIGQEAQGREVIYVAGQYGNKMHIMPSKQDSLLPPMHMSFAPDDTMVRSKTRHDIREAGLSEAIRGIGNSLDMAARNPAQRKRLRYLGQVTRPEYPKMEAVEDSIPPRTEALLPQGGKRVYFFDTGTNSASAGLPVLIVTHDAAAKEVEYYCFDRMTTRIRLTDKDFDPEQVWKKK
jgi:Protein of unknown function (DUF1571)